MPICNKCDEPFHSRRSDALYCSIKCRVAAHREATSPSVTRPSVTYRASVPEVIEANFRELPAPVSDSRALVPIQGAAQPADSRLSAALAQHERARRSSPGRGLARLPNPFFASLNGLYVADPNGDAALTALAGAIAANTRAVQTADARAAHERERQRLMDQKAARAAAEKAEERARVNDVNVAIRQMLGLDRQTPPAPQGMMIGLLQQQNTPDVPVQEVAGLDQVRDGHGRNLRAEFPLYEEDEQSFEDDELPETDLEIMRDARAEQKRQAASPDYGDSPFNAWTDEATCRTIVKPMLKAATFEELLLLNKIRRAEQAARAARSPKPEPNSVHRFLTKSKTKSIPESGGQPPAPRSGWDWLRARFSTPTRGVWK